MLASVEGIEPTSGLVVVQRVFKGRGEDISPERQRSLLKIKFLGLMGYKPQEIGSAVFLKLIRFFLRSKRREPKQTHTPPFQSVLCQVSLSTTSLLSLSRLGFVYEHGRGVKQDDTEAVRWFRPAARAGGCNGRNSTLVPSATMVNV